MACVIGEIEPNRHSAHIHNTRETGPILLYNAKCDAVRAQCAHTQDRPPVLCVEYRTYTYLTYLVRDKTIRFMCAEPAVALEQYAHNIEEYR